MNNNKALYIMNCFIKVQKKSLAVTIQSSTRHIPSAKGCQNYVDYNLNHNFALIKNSHYNYKKDQDNRDTYLFFSLLNFILIGLKT